MVKNAAARMLTRNKHQHISPLLASPHLLPVGFRIDFKLLVLVYKSLDGFAPKYLSD